MKKAILVDIYRINCHIADRYFQFCRQGHDFPSYEGLKEFGWACIESRKEKAASRLAPENGSGHKDIIFTYSITPLSVSVKGNVVKHSSPPCYGCGKRHVGCHSPQCPEWLTWEADKQEFQENVRREKQVEQGFQALSASRNAQSLLRTIHDRSRGRRYW